MQTSNAGQPLVRVRGVGQVYGQGSAALTVLEQVDLTLNAGEIVGLLGRSGSASPPCCARSPA